MSLIARLWQTHRGSEFGYRAKTYFTISYLMMSYSLIYGVLYLSLIPSRWGLAINSGAFAIYAISVFYIERHNVKAAQLTQLCTFVVHLLAVSFVFSTRTGYHFYFILVPVIAFLFFEFDQFWEKTITIAFTIISIVSFIICELYATQVYSFGISDLMYKILFYVGIALIMLGLFIALWIFNVTLKRAEKRLILLSTTDVLTGAHNRRHFLEHAEIELIRSQRYENPLAILMIDIDYFKRTNDTYGHQAGDNVLKEVAAACQECVRRTDYFARVGGEEFAALLVDVKKEHAIMVSERIRRTIEELPVPHTDEALHVTISIGLAFYENHEQTLSALLSEADAELYRAKENGRNRVEYADSV